MNSVLSLLNYSFTSCWVLCFGVTCLYLLTLTLENKKLDFSYTKQNSSRESLSPIYKKFWTLYYCPITHGVIFGKTLQGKNVCKMTEKWQYPGWNFTWGVSDPNLQVLFAQASKHKHAFTVNSLCQPSCHLLPLPLNLCYSLGNPKLQEL